MRAAITFRITRTPGVCGGSACVAGHRLSVWNLVRHRQPGVSDAGLLEAYPWLDATGLEAAWEYDVSHRVEIENDIRENEE